MKLTVTFSGDTQAMPTTMTGQSRTFAVGFSGTSYIHDGQNGATFYPSVSDDGLLTWTNDRNLPNPSPVNIRGADGKPGAKGDKGDRGDQGVQGIQGPAGAKGDKGDKGEQGPAGATGQPGADGKPGADGYTPVKGVDFYTDADKAEMVAAVIAALPIYGGETA